MKITKNRSLKLLKVFHLLSAFLWTGGAFCMMILVFFVKPDEGYGMQTFAVSLKMIDDWMVIIGAIGCFITGLLYGIVTRWGFFKHRWITVKWITALYMMISGTFAMGPCVDGNVLLSEDKSQYRLNSEMFWNNVLSIKWWGAIQILLLVVTIIISIYKPWERKKWNNHNHNIGITKNDA